MNSEAAARRLMDEFAAAVPDPVRYLARPHGRLIRAANNLGLADDLFGLCWLGIAKAARLYRADGGAAFPTFAVAWMRSYVSTAVRSACGPRRQRGERFAVSLSAVRPADDAHREDTLADQLAGPDVWAEHERADEERHVLATARRVLAPSARAAVLGFYGIGGHVGEDELCRRYDLRPNQVRRLRAAAVEVLRRRLSDGGRGRPNS